jgi:hypothetical protein
MRFFVTDHDNSDIIYFLEAQKFQMYARSTVTLVRSNKENGLSSEIILSGGPLRIRPVFEIM